MSICFSASQIITDFLRLEYGDFCRDLNQFGNIGWLRGISEAPLSPSDYYLYIDVNGTWQKLISGMVLILNLALICWES